MSEDVHPAGVIAERYDIASPLAQSLIEALNAELTSQYPDPDATHFRLDPSKVAEGQERSWSRRGCPRPHYRMRPQVNAWRWATSRQREEGTWTLVRKL